MGRTYYKECKICGANLDPGERCTCMDTPDRRERETEKLLIGIYRHRRKEKEPEAISFRL